MEKAAGMQRRNTVSVNSRANGTGDPGPVVSTVVLVLFGASAVALAVAPAALDESYSWVEHTTSQAGAQGVAGAWVARMGFVLFGLAVIWLSHGRARTWRQPAAALHVAFGVCLVAVAAFSLRSWQPGAPFDRTEDLLHSVSATAMGFAFALGVAAAAWWPGRPTKIRVLDVVAVVASIVIPLAMSAAAGYAGALQRAMFAIAYLWYAREAVEGMRLGVSST